ncbi:hypothetical protein LY13_004658 [Prauserella aidingensis]|uniref:hypothetical protein n=1 Tax=Prauserella aidingensis TaxID=387890 RepID=UPI0027E2C2C8|nr:hypothetical protein [Prauserella aidingensis]MCP2255876.1 hypothetical protein [Prauserella aidingensis]
MDPRDRADAVLARAQRRSGVVTPDNMRSPMDSDDTQVIPSSVVRSADQDPDATAKVPASVIERNDESHLSQPSPTVPLNQREAAARAAADPAASSQDTAPQQTAPALAENARTQPLAPQGAQPVDTANAPPDMTFTGVPVTPGARNPAAQNAAAQNAAAPTSASQNSAPANTAPQNTAPQPATGDDGRSDEASAGGFVPTTKVEPGSGTSELARRLEGL